MGDAVQITHGQFDAELSDLLQYLMDKLDARSSSWVNHARSNILTLIDSDGDKFLEINIPMSPGIIIKTFPSFGSSNPNSNESIDESCEYSCKVRIKYHKVYSCPVIYFRFCKTFEDEDGIEVIKHLFDHSLVDYLIYSHSHSEGKIEEHDDKEKQEEVEDIDEYLGAPSKFHEESDNDLELPRVSNVNQSISIVESDGGSWYSIHPCFTNLTISKTKDNTLISWWEIYNIFV